MAPQPPGWRWGPFTARLPLIHFRPEWPELLQGLFVAATTGLAVTPIYADLFGMGFETAVALVVVQSLIIYSAFLLFGEPFCPGWLTPALPLVLARTAAFPTADERIDFVNAVVLATAGLFLLFGLTGLGRRFFQAIPRVVRAGIILGAGLSAFLGETLPRSGGRPPRLEAYPASIALATGVTLLLLFSRPLARWKERSPAAAFVASLGVAPGFFLAMLLGPLFGEIRYGGLFENGLVFKPDFAGLAAFNALGRGLPAGGYWLEALPLALTAYLVGVGDLITGEAIVGDAARQRPDESIVFDRRRSHLTLGLRNLSVGLLGGPFFPLQGPLWAGATVIVAERYRRGRAQMQTLFSGIASYYLFGLPILYFCGPALALFRPALDVAFSLTLLLTGFACGALAMAEARDRLERGIALSVAAAIAFGSLAAGVALGFALAATLLGREAWRDPQNLTSS
ncbi:MAG: hypothetical protein GC160_04785 [Acidobacteria bacterium]|nr:hypothetical protein [Acidobacteriota bacterium]